MNLRGALLCLRPGVTRIERLAPDAANRQWTPVSAVNEFHPLPWSTIKVHGSGMTSESAYNAYELALSECKIPSRQDWMWWRKFEKEASNPYVGPWIRIDEPPSY